MGYSIRRPFYTQKSNKTLKFNRNYVNMYVDSVDIRPIEPWNPKQKFLTKLALGLIWDFEGP